MSWIRNQEQAASHAAGFSAQIRAQYGERRRAVYDELPILITKMARKRMPIPERQ